MASLVKMAPDGFGNAVEQMNLLKQETLTELSNEVIQFLQYKVGAVNAEKWKEKIQDDTKEITLEQSKSIINALIYLYREASHKKLTVEEFTADLASSMVFSESTRSILCSIWSQQGRQLIASGLGDRSLGVGQLVDVQWKVGMAMSSDSCRQLNSPFVTLTLTIADTSGNIKTHPLELTMEQFRNFTKQLKEIGRVLELV